MRVADIVKIDARRSKVLTDEDFAFLLYQRELEEFQIHIGRELDHYKTQIEPCLKKRALSRCLHILKAADKTRYELMRKLREDFYPKEVIYYALSYCQRQGYVDDGAYATAYAQRYGESKSIFRIRRELLKKGVKAELIESALQDMEQTESEQLMRILQKEDIQKTVLDKSRLQKLTARLLRRGYRYQQIKDCIQRLCE